MNQIVYFMILFLCPIFGIAQEISLEDDFEGNGTIDSWFGFQTLGDIDLPNPHQEGINTSETVLFYEDTGYQYALVGFDAPYNFDFREHRTFTMKIYVESSSLTGNQPNQVSVKVLNMSLDEPWTTQSEIIKPLIMDEWQELSFDFLNDPVQNFNPDSPDPVNRSDFSRLIIQLNGENNNDEVRAYIDDFSFDGTVGPVFESDDFDVLVWSDEFDTDGPVDPLKWHHQTEIPTSSGWFNNEIQHYTDRIDNSYVENGFLYISAKQETYTDQGLTLDYTSARLNSKFAFTHGKVEVRAQMPFGVGTWPAIWTLGKNIIEPGNFWSETYGTVPWPQCGEIDIMEHWGNDQNHVTSAMHTPSSFGATVNVRGVDLPTVSDEFHVYTMEWTPDEIRFFIDGVNHYVYAPLDQNPETWPFTEDQYLLLNVAMIEPVAQNFTQSDMVVDYVRVYQEEPLSANGVAEKADFKVFPNPTKGILNLQLEQDLVGSVMTIYSAKGELLTTSLIQNTFESVDLSGYSSGIYMVSIQKGDKQVLKKVVVD